MKIFDQCIIMKDKQGYATVDGTIEKLDEMLNVHNIPHAFALPTATELDADQNTAAVLYYDIDNHMEVSLIYALFCKLYRGLESDKIAGALVKVASHYITVGEAV